MNLSRTRGERLIIIRLLTQELQELFLILANELRNLGVSSGDLLEDGFEHLWLLLDQLTKLLEVGVIPQKFEAREFSTTGSTSSSASSLLATSLSSSFEQVDRFVVTSGRGAFGSSRLGCASGGGLLLLFLLDVFRNTLLKVSARSGNPIAGYQRHELTFKRYSMARSGLKKAALIARFTSLRAKPIASI